MGYYVIKFFSDAYTLQEDTTCDGICFLAGELVVKAQYLKYMQENTKCYWEKKHQQQVIIFPTLTIVNPCIDVMLVKYVHDIPRNACNRNQVKQYMFN